MYPDASVAEDAPKKKFVKGFNNKKINYSFTNNAAITYQKSVTN